MQNQKNMNKQGLSVFTQFRDEWTQRALFLTIMGVAMVVCFHDYPGYTHADFLHELLLDDLSVKGQEPLTQSALIIGGADTIRAGVDMNYVSHIWPLADNVKPVTGFYRLYSGLSPPGENVKQFPGFYGLISGLSLPTALHRDINLKSHASLISLIPAFLAIFMGIQSLSLSRPLSHQSIMGKFFGNQTGFQGRNLTRDMATNLPASAKTIHIENYLRH